MFQIITKRFLRKPIITDHAYVRWMERIKNFNVKKVQAQMICDGIKVNDRNTLKFMVKKYKVNIKNIKKEMLNDRIIKTIMIIGSGKVPNDENIILVVQQYMILTVYAK